MGQHQSRQRSNKKASAKDELTKVKPSEDGKSDLVKDTLQSGDDATTLCSTNQQTSRPSGPPRHQCILSPAAAFRSEMEASASTPSKVDSGEQKQQERYVTVYKVVCHSHYQPHFVKSPPSPKECPLCTSKDSDDDGDTIPNLDDFVAAEEEKRRGREEVEDLLFVVIRDWACRLHPGMSEKPQGLTIRPVAAELRRFLESEALCQTDVTEEEIMTDAGSDIMAKRPADGHYSIRWLYHHRDVMLSHLAGLQDSGSRDDIGALLSYMSDESPAASLMQRCDDEFAVGLVSCATLPWLFRPNEILIKVKAGEAYNNPSAMVPLTWLEPGNKSWTNSHRREPPVEVKLSFGAWCWDRDHKGAVAAGGVLLRRSSHTQTVDVPRCGAAVPITDLNVYPLRFASEETKALILSRGRMYRDIASPSQQLVSYQGFECSRSRSFAQGSRFMIDNEGYVETVKLGRLPNKSKPYFEPSNGFPRPGDTWPVTRSDFKDMSDEEVMLLPTKVLGFSLDEHVWAFLNVKNITQIKWDKQAFGRLVLPLETKTLIRGVVIGQAKRQSRIDWDSARANEGVGGRGSGDGAGMSLVIHGPRGTGKSAIIEAAAELAELPVVKLTRRQLIMDGVRGDMKEARAGYETVSNELVSVGLEKTLDLASRWGAVLLFDDFFIMSHIPDDVVSAATFTLVQDAVATHRGLSVVTLPEGCQVSAAKVARGAHLTLEFAAPGRDERCAIWAGVLDRMLGEGVIDPADEELFELRVALSVIASTGPYKNNLDAAAAVVDPASGVWQTCEGYRQQYASVEHASLQTWADDKVKHSLLPHRLTGRQIVSMAAAARRLAACAGRGVRLEDFELVLRTSKS